MHLQDRPLDEGTVVRADDLGLPYAHEVIDHVEASSCSRGCTRAVNPTPDMPGGSCEFLAAAAVGDMEVPFRWKGKVLVCDRRRPIPQAVRDRLPVGQEALW